ncbi:MAG: hypothetical protein ACAI44_22715 [Candidatus Sericytochromatia bacterium]
MQHIDSVAKLEALLLMKKHVSQEWDAALLAQRLYINTQQAGAILSALGKAGLCRLSEPGGSAYRFDPVQPGMSEVVDRLELVYSRQLIPITNLIHLRTSSPLQHFSDAFKFKKEDT